MAERYRPNESYSPDEDENHDAPAAHIPPPPGGGGSRASVVPVAGQNDQRLDREVQRAQEQLLSLKRQQETIERQKRELEELSRRQEELERGKGEMTEKLTRALVILERQSTEAQKRVEQLRATTEGFSNHLRALDGIQPKSWAGPEMPKELNRALSLVDHARSEFNQSRARLTTPDPAATTPGGEVSTAAAASANDYEEMFQQGSDRPFLHWVRNGTAFTLPLLLLGLLWLAIHIWLVLSVRP